MKKILLIIISLLLFSCKSREKAVQKTETQTEKKSEATYHIEDKTFEIVFDKSKIFKDFSYKNSSEETSKQEKKNTDKGKEYNENSNQKAEAAANVKEKVTNFSGEGNIILERKLNELASVIQTFEALCSNYSSDCCYPDRSGVLRSVIAFLYFRHCQCRNPAGRNWWEDSGCNRRGRDE